MSDNEINEEKLINLFDFKVGNSVGQSHSNKNPYFHFVFSEECDKSINFSKPASIELDENEETIKVSFGGISENEEPSHLLSGRRFEDNTDEVDEDSEKNYLLIFDETTKTYTLECLDYEFRIASYDAELAREMESLMQKEEMEEEDQSYTPNGGYSPDDCEDEEEDDGYEEKFREEMMEIEGNGENGITVEEYEDEDDWMEDDRLEEVDAPSPQPAAEDDMYGPMEDEDDITKDEISGSSNSSSSGTTSSSSSDSDNSGDDGSDSTESELESELGDIEAQMKQSMNSVAKSPRVKKDLNTAGVKRPNGEGNPISLAALLGEAEEQDQEDSSDDSD